MILFPYPLLTSSVHSLESPFLFLILYFKVMKLITTRLILYKLFETSTQTLNGFFFSTFIQFFQFVWVWPLTSKCLKDYSEKSDFTTFYLKVLLLKWLVGRVRIMKCCLRIICCWKVNILGRWFRVGSKSLNSSASASTDLNQHSVTSFSVPFQSPLFVLNQNQNQNRPLEPDPGSMKSPMLSRFWTMQISGLFYGIMERKASS